MMFTGLLCLEEKLQLEVSTHAKVEMSITFKVEVKANCSGEPETYSQFQLDNCYVFTGLTGLNSELTDNTT